MSEPRLAEQRDCQHIVQELYAALYRFGLSLSRKDCEAADLVQQTFYTWMAKGHQLRDHSKVKTWLFTTLYRHFLSQKRHDSHFVQTEDESQFIDPMQVPSSVINALDAATVQEALQTLDERFRAPITLFYMQLHSYRDIAQILDIPIGTVMSRISHGKAKLRQALSDSATAATVGARGRIVQDGASLRADI